MARWLCSRKVGAKKSGRKLKWVLGAGCYSFFLCCVLHAGSIHQWGQVTLWMLLGSLDLMAPVCWTITRISLLYTQIYSFQAPGYYSSLCLTSCSAAWTATFELHCCVNFASSPSLVQGWGFRVKQVEELFNQCPLVGWFQVGGSFGCARRAVLDERIKSSDLSMPALLGTMLHQLFQVLLSLFFSWFYWQIRLGETLGKPKRDTDPYTLHLRISRDVFWWTAAQENWWRKDVFWDVVGCKVEHNLCRWACGQSQPTVSFCNTRQKPLCSATLMASIP